MTHFVQTQKPADPARSRTPAPQPVPFEPNEYALLRLQRTVGNAAIQRWLQRQDAVEMTEAPDETSLTEVPQVDMSGRRSGRAYQMDWDSVHREIDGLQGSTLREAFLLHLFERLAQFLPDTFIACTSYEEVQQILDTAIAEAEAAGDFAEAERLQRQFNIAAQFAVVDTLDVEDSARYEPVEGGPTYCNIYAYDVISALGGYLPRVWWNDDVLPRIQAGEQVEPIYGETIHEMNANALTVWFDEWGAYFGWDLAGDMTEAQQAANNGELSIIVAANKNPKRSGHITVVMPETPGHEATSNEAGEVVVPMQSQAGRNNLEYGTTGEWWSNSSHVDGAAYIYRGERRSELLTPELATPDNAVTGRVPARR